MKKRCGWMVVWMLLGLFFLSGCAANGVDGYKGGLGGVLPKDYGQEELCLQVRGEMCRTSPDGYTPPSLTPMEGMGVGATDIPMAFSAEIWTGAPMEGGVARPFRITYTSPESLAGVTVSCEMPLGESGLPEERYTLSLRDEATFSVSREAVGGLIRPLLALLPSGDVTKARREGDLTHVTLTDATGGRGELTFDKAFGKCPVAAAWQDSHGWLRMRVTGV